MLRTSSPRSLLQCGHGVTRVVCALSQGGRADRPALVGRDHPDPAAAAVALRRAARGHPRHHRSDALRAPARARRRGHRRAHGHPGDAGARRVLPDRRRAGRWRRRSMPSATGPSAGSKRPEPPPPPRPPAERHVASRSPRPPPGAARALVSAHSLPGTSRRARRSSAGASCTFPISSRESKGSASPPCRRGATVGSVSRSCAKRGRAGTVARATMTKGFAIAVMMAAGAMIVGRAGAAGAAAGRRAAGWTAAGTRRRRHARGRRAERQAGGRRRGRRPRAQGLGGRVHRLSRHAGARAATRARISCAPSSCCAIATAVSSGRS